MELKCAEHIFRDQGDLFLIEKGFPRLQSPGGMTIIFIENLLFETRFSLPPDGNQINPRKNQQPRNCLTHGDLVLVQQ